MLQVSTGRRLALAGLAASLLPLREAVAQTAASGGDWFAMIQKHHALVAASLEKLLASDKSTYLAREQLVRMIGYQLTAHSVAEENVIYPAIAMAGMTTDSDKLYLDQAHAKVMNAQLEMQARLKDKGNWKEAARTLQDAVLKHAKEDEEGRLYPQLRSKLSAAENALLTAGYQREFSSVKLTRAAT
ncbi:MAG TPA: hemerythrin domain-containing protein [Ramlibacter sp.]|jgi:hemerythrin superfamily protein|uniref:hemerythrin domain-containing protein n=1 Tax=Ramlibacter sp. TaxID=1917967 RepID=UPI002D663C18|nr:hemerythrin domain-containing protein [Ramlibacter sp.]HZY17719.1 hemerythrin domain-containing protein [Ramlibacter sp.]